MDLLDGQTGVRHRFRIKELKTPGGSGGFNFFRDNVACIANLQQYQIVFQAKTRWKTLYPVDVNGCLRFSLHNFDQGLHASILEELRNDAGIGADHGTSAARLQLFLCGPKREAFENFYVSDAALRPDNKQERMNIGDLMNLDHGGRNVAPDLSRDGTWLTPNASGRRKESTAEERGIAVFDGPRAWDRWGDILRRSTRILVFSRSSSSMRHDRVKTILEFVGQRLDRALIAEGHPWFKDRAPIRGFVHEWRQ